MFRLILSAIIFVIISPKHGNSKFNTELPLNEISSHGYFAEAHQTTTEDGYILTMIRVPFQRWQSGGSPDRPVVFCMHGLYSSSSSFLAGGQRLSIAYHLADAGFDVWLGNARGNSHSRAHVTLDPRNPEEREEFFNFTWEQIGMYDVPAMIDYALNHTGKEKLFYIGHSQGGTSFLVMSTMRPEYADKIATAHLLAGVGYMDYFPFPPLAIMAQFSDRLYSRWLSLGIVAVNLDFIGNLFDRENYIKAEVCSGDIEHKDLCEKMDFQDLLRSEVINNRLMVLGGGSTKQLAHYGQNIRDKEFRRFNYGSQLNQQLYGSVDPPIYDLSLITSNVTMHYTVSDILLDERDVHNMAAKMPNTVVRRVARDSFGHNDFLFAEDAKDLVTDYIIEAIDYHHNRVIEQTPPVTGASVAVNATPILYLIISFIYHLY